MGWEWHFSLWASLKFYLFNQRNFLKHNVALQGHSFVLQFQMTLRRAVLIPHYGVYRLLRYPIQVVILSNILWTIALFLVSDLFSYIPFFVIKWPLCASLQISLFAVWIFLTWFIFLSDEPLGDWAGSSYTTSGCPGTCSERLMDGSNFVVSLFLKKKFTKD